MRHSRSLGAGHLLDARRPPSAASREAVLGEQDVGAVDEDGREEPAIADLARDALGVGQRGLGADRVAGQQLGLGVEHRHPDRGLVQPELVAARRASGRAASRACSKSPAIASSTATKPRTPSSAKRRPATLRQQLVALGPRGGHRHAVDDERPGDDADARVELDGAAGAAGEAQGLARLAQAPLRRALQPRELAHQVARPRDADVVAERLERHGGVLGDDERRRRGPPTRGAGRRACARARPRRAGARDPDPAATASSATAPLAPGCWPRTARRPWPAAARRGRRRPAPGAPGRARGRRSPTAGRRAGAPSAPPRRDAPRRAVRERVEPRGRRRSSLAARWARSSCVPIAGARLRAPRRPGPRASRPAARARRPAPPAASPHTRRRGPARARSETRADRR